MGDAITFANGVASALVLPFTEDDKIDEISLRKLVEYNLNAPKINGLVCNAFAGETFSLTSEERGRVVRILKDQVDGRVPVVAGVWAEGLDDVKREVEIAQREGADAILLFPPFSFARGANVSSEIPVKFHQAVAEYASVPIIAFQTRAGTGTHYSSETLAEICKIKQVFAVKNACFDLNVYEANTAAVRSAVTNVEVLTGCDTILVPTMYLSDGGLLGLASLTPHFLSKLMEWVKDGNVKDAFALQGQYYELVSEIYRHPAMDIPGRLKAGLVHLGVIESARVREPWRQLGKEDQSRIAQLIAKLGGKEL